VSEARLRELEGLDRLEEAARVAEEIGRWRDATRLWERACHFDKAALAALAGNDPAHAVELAARSTDVAVEEKAVAALAAAPDLARQVAFRLAELGRPATAGRIQSALGEHALAAEAFERAARWTLAAKSHERAGDPRRAAKCLETALEIDANDEPARLSLGALLARHGKHEQALRILQRVKSDAPERGPALTLLRRSLAALGMTEGVAEVEREMNALGVALDAEPAERSSVHNALGGEVLFGRYRTEEQIARTPTARVYRARDLVTSELVAVKLFAASTLRDAGRDALRRFEREAVVLGKLRHPAIVPLAAFVPDGPAVVLAWMAGGSLADRLATGVLSPARSVEVASAVLTALSEAHRRGILHRDIKPANVLFDEAEAAYLADFGTAHVSDAAVTVTAGIIGTLAYMAPEQRRGQPANVSSDVYGVGALLWHALTGAPPDAKLPFLSSELDERHRAIAHRLVGSEAERPDNADAARALLASVRWPTEVPPTRAVSPASERRRPSGRLEPHPGGGYVDLVLGRRVLVLEGTASNLERVLAFARADHPGLESVLAHKPEDRSVWLESLDKSRAPLAERDRAFLSEALGALHRSGGFHGAVDAEHLAWRGDQPVLCFPSAPYTSGAEADLEGLSRLP
jgi:serine/threonine-protein kinase